jgi:hypothetical protein
VKHRRRTRRSLVLVLAAVLAAATGTSPAGAEPPATAEAAAPATAGHPFSDPLWLPLREPARISCTHSNPGTE